MTTPPTHLLVPPDGLSTPHSGGRVCFLPGSRSRAEAIASRFANAKVFRGPRGHDVYTGQIEGSHGLTDVATVHTGMGAPSVDIVVTELIRLGVRRFLRVGTAGSLQDDVRVGHLVIATGAVRDEGASRAYAPLEFPAIASPRVTECLKSAAMSLGLKDRTHSGVVHSKDSLMAREFGAGPLTELNASYMRTLRRLGVLASEMEAAHLFLLAQVYSLPRRSVEAGAILAVVGDEPEDSGSKSSGEENAIAVALQAASAIARRERTGDF